MKQLLLSVLLLAAFSARAQCGPNSGYAPTNLQVANITATTATVTFNGGAGVLGCYTSISYTYAGSSPVSVPYAMPLLLTGLPPGTAITVTVIRKINSNVVGSSCCSITANSSFTTAGSPLAAATPAEASSLALAPNPARTNSTLTMAAPLPTPATVQVFDALGREVRRLPLPARAATATLDLAGLPASLYLVRVGGNAARLVVE